jgi:CoA:oxalate CoA-transferase
MDAMHHVMAYEYAESQFPGLQGHIVFRPMRTSDGFVAVAPVSEGNFKALARAAGRPEWTTDQRFADRKT